MSSTPGRIAALLFTRGIPVHVHSPLPAPHCAHIIDQLRDGPGPLTYGPTPRWGVRGRLTDSGFRLWLPGLQQSSYTLMAARLLPDSTGQGAWIVGLVRLTLIVRIMILVVLALSLFVVASSLLPLLQGDTRGLVPQVLILPAIFTWWVSRSLRTDRIMRSWLAGELRAVQADLPTVRS